MTRYDHPQIGHVIIWSLVAIILIVSCGLMESSARRGPPVMVSIILLVCLILFYRLRITIDAETLCASFGIGVIRKRVGLAEIVACKPIHILWWHGWGIHLTPYGWLYNVPGFDAVAIKLRDGRQFALGTDDPQGLTAGIRDAICVNWAAYLLWGAHASRMLASASSRSRTFSAVQPQTIR